jgi:rRNA maturation endonuclease Nob1
LKNLNSVRAGIKVSIDGEDVLDNSSLVLDANSDTVLEGFLRGTVARNRFRFINKTQEISDHRGDRADDGLIRVEFAFETPQLQPWIMNTIKEVHHYYEKHPIKEYTYYHNDWNTSGGMGPQSIYTNSVGDNARGIVAESNITMDSLGVQNVSQTPNLDEGITVKGSEVNQQFNYASLGNLEDPKVIVIALKGITQSGQSVSQTVTVKEKLICSSCGTKSNSSFKFCPTCGTFLE